MYGKDVRLYAPVITLCKWGLEYLCFLLKVTSKSGQNLELDPSSQLPAPSLHPVYSCALTFQAKMTL
jgi:hypothetical protein